MRSGSREVAGLRRDRFLMANIPTSVHRANYQSQARKESPEIRIFGNSSSVWSSPTGRRHSQTDTRPHARARSDMSTVQLPSRIS